MYEILAPLGAGGMGEVYRARDGRLERDVALKVLPAEVASRPERLERFQREARAVAALNHPNIVTLHSMEESEGVRFLTMELVEGQTLATLLGSRGLPVSRALDLVIPLAEALVAAHERGIVHRDLKPSNIMVTREGRVKVMDFGLAKLFPADSDAELSRAATLDALVSSPGTVVGTAPYMSPEQLRGAPVDARTDLFAFGVVLYELLAGRRPFDGITTADVMSAILRQEPDPLDALRPDIPPHLARILRRCLAKDPDRRIQTSKDVRNELEELRDDLASGAASSVTERLARQPIQRCFALTSAHVRQLSVRNPRLIGHRVRFLDNQVESETLVFLLHAMGGDHLWFERALRAMPYRVISLSLVGFAPEDTHRPVLGIDDHSQILRIVLRELAGEVRPRTTLLVAHSAGADHFLRMNAEEGGVGIDVDGIVALGANVSMETLFVSRQYVDLDCGDPDAILGVLKGVGENTRGLATWLAIQMYIAQTFMKFGSDLEPLRRYACDSVAPFVAGGDPLADWYRAARARIPSVRLVFSNEEAAPAEALLARHLEDNVLGDRFEDSSFVIEPVHHMALLEPKLVLRHVESVLREVRGNGARP